MIKWFERHNNLSLGITIFLAVFIFYMSSITFSDFGTGIYNASWMSIVYHITIFFFLSLFFFISILKGRNNYFLLFSLILILIAYGALDELHQSFVIGRFTAVLDLVFDSVGILFASMIYLISLYSRKVL